MTYSPSLSGALSVGADISAGNGNFSVELSAATTTFKGAGYYIAPLPPLGSQSSRRSVTASEAHDGDEQRLVAKVLWDTYTLMFRRLQLTGGSLTTTQAPTPLHRFMHTSVRRLSGSAENDPLK